VRPPKASRTRLRNWRSPLMDFNANTIVRAWMALRYLHRFIEITSLVSLSKNQPLNNNHSTDSRNGHLFWLVDLCRNAESFDAPQ